MRVYYILIQFCIDLNFEYWEFSKFEMEYLGNLSYSMNKIYIKLEKELLVQDFWLIDFYSIRNLKREEFFFALFVFFHPLSAETKTPKVSE